MRVAWSALIVLVLLAPFGRVGITATPLDTEVLTAPRSATSATTACLELEPQPDRTDRARAHGGLAAMAAPMFVGVEPWRTASGLAAMTAPRIAVYVASAQAQPRAPPV